MIYNFFFFTHLLEGALEEEHHGIQVILLIVYDQNALVRDVHDWVGLEDDILGLLAVLVTITDMSLNIIDRDIKYGVSVDGHNRSRRMLICRHRDQLFFGGRWWLTRFNTNIFLAWENLLKGNSYFLIVDFEWVVSPLSFRLFFHQPNGKYIGVVRSATLKLVVCELSGNNTLSLNSLVLAFRFFIFMDREIS